MSTADDNQLLADYAEQRSEKAFQALVERHAGLVYSTALRQLNDAALAQEVAQNVFLAIARKPDSFRREATLAGRLYKTTLLQCRQAIRTELRRRQRETTAMELASLHAPEASEPLLPLLDEALMRLREPERLAIMLRFFESRPLREVGAALGVSEDAAQKRVAQALEGLARYFRRQGFAVPSLAAGASLWTAAARAVPAGLSSAIAQAALRQAAFSTGGATALFLAKLMALSKTQTIGAALVIAAAPAFFQWQNLKGAQDEQSRIRANLRAAQADLDAAGNTLTTLEKQRRLAESSLPFIRENARRPASPPPSLDRDAAQDSAGPDFVRVPKSVLASIDIPSIQFQGGSMKLSDEISAALGVTPEEEAAVQRAFAGAVQQLHQYAASHFRPSQDHSPAFTSSEPMEKVTFVAAPDPVEGPALSNGLHSALSTALGPERANLLWDKSSHDLERTFFGFGQHEQRVTLSRVSGDASGIYLTSERRANGSTFGVTSGNFSMDIIPEPFKSVVERWKAQSRP